MATKPTTPVQPPHGLIATLLLTQSRHELEDLIEASLALLDAQDGDADFESTDLEDDHELSHRARDRTDHGGGCTISDPGEDDDPPEDDDSDRCGAGDDIVRSGNLNCGGLFYEDAGPGDETDAEYGDLIGHRNMIAKLRDERCWAIRSRWDPREIERHTLRREPLVPTRRSLINRRRGMPVRPRA